MTTAGRAWLIARTDLTILLRQRETILWVFLMPAIFFYFIGTVTGGFGSPRRSVDRPDPLALKSDAEDGILAGELVRRLEEQNYGVIRAATDEEFGGYPRRLSITVPDGYKGLTDAVLAGQQVG